MQLCYVIIGSGDSQRLRRCDGAGKSAKNVFNKQNVYVNKLENWVYRDMWCPNRRILGTDAKSPVHSLLRRTVRQSHRLM